MLSIVTKNWIYDTLIIQNKILKAIDCGNFYRIVADNRDLNYDKYFSEGNKHLDISDSYHSHNTDKLDVEGMKKLLKRLELFGGDVKQHD